MIRIPTYKEHPRGEKIYARYMYLLALVLPFSAESILDNDVLLVDGKRITAENFIDESKKKPRIRNAGYRKLLSDYGICQGKVDQKLEEERIPEKNEKPGRRRRLDEKFQEDQLLAARIIEKASKSLYHFLYKDKWENVTVPEMKREHLRELLLSKMDTLCCELRSIPQISKDYAEILLKNVFRYDAFSSNRQVAALMKEMDVHVCPYCNRQYTVTAIGRNGTSRPQFDHYKSKMRYPYFAVSLFNLIPSCGFCNQRKADREVEVLYPYSDEMGTDVVFRTRIKNGVRYLLGEADAIDEFELEFVLKNHFLPPEKAEKMKHSDEVFNLTELYNEHKDYVLYLFQKRYVYSEEYLEFFSKEFPQIFQSLEEIKRIIYLMDIDPGQWGKRPLSKLTHDIDNEIEELLGAFV